LHTGEYNSFRGCWPLSLIPFLIREADSFVEVVVFLLFYLGTRIPIPTEYINLLSLSDRDIASLAFFALPRSSPFTIHHKCHDVFLYLFNVAIEVYDLSAPAATKMNKKNNIYRRIDD